jgi:hypothetical protein
MCLRVPHPSRSVRRVGSYHRTPRSFFSSLLGLSFLVLSSRAERPDFFFRAAVWRVGPRSGGISPPLLQRQPPRTHHHLFPRHPSIRRHRSRGLGLRAQRPPEKPPLAIGRRAMCTRTSQCDIITTRFSPRKPSLPVQFLTLRYNRFILMHLGKTKAPLSKLRPAPLP